MQSQVVPTPYGFLVFDDTIVDKNFSHQIDLVRRQYSGNAHAIIKGIGVVTCVYVNPETDQSWIIDYRIYNPAGDGKTKLDHVAEMMQGARSPIAAWTACPGPPPSSNAARSSKSRAFQPSTR
jgi:hypothetical protein